MRSSIAASRFIDAIHLLDRIKTELESRFLSMVMGIRFDDFKMVFYFFQSESKVFRLLKVDKECTNVTECMVGLGINSSFSFAIWLFRHCYNPFYRRNFIQTPNVYVGVLKEAVKRQE